jgi:hypothetical protein
MLESFSELRQKKVELEMELSNVITRSLREFHRETGFIPTISVSVRVDVLHNFCSEQSEYHLRCVEVEADIRL